MYDEKNLNLNGTSRDVGTAAHPSHKVLSDQIVGNIGMYYVCYHLSRLGWNVMPTARNARGVDIIAYTPDAKKYLGLQVKSLSSGSAAAPVGNSLDKVIGDRWIIVNKVASAAPSVFIMFPHEVMERAERRVSQKNGKVSYWLQRPDYMQDEFREAWHRLDMPCSVPVGEG